MAGTLQRLELKPTSLLILLIILFTGCWTVLSQLKLGAAVWVTNAQLLFITNQVVRTVFSTLVSSEIQYIISKLPHSSLTSPFCFPLLPQDGQDFIPSVTTYFPASVAVLRSLVPSLILCPWQVQCWLSSFKVLRSSSVGNPILTGFDHISQKLQQSQEQLRGPGWQRLLCGYLAWYSLPRKEGGLLRADPWAGT